MRVWSMSGRTTRRMLSLLKEAYVKARYSKQYRIEADDLAWLGERVQELSAIVQQVCAEHLAALERAASGEKEKPTPSAP